MLSAAGRCQMDEEIAMMPVAEEGGIALEQHPEANTVFNLAAARRQQLAGIPVQPGNPLIPVNGDKHWGTV